MTQHPTIEIPEFLNHLPVYRGFPIPFGTFVHEGKPDFRVTDMQRWDECVKLKLCGICGLRLGEYSYFIGGPQCKEHRLFFDPPMHEPCAEFSSKMCPYLNGRKTEYRPLSGPPPAGIKIEIVEVSSDVRPDEMFMFKARTKGITLVRVNGRLCIKSPVFSGIREF